MREFFAIACGLLLMACSDVTATTSSREGLDVFLIGGQSNALGHGDSLQSPAVPSGAAYEWDARNQRLTDANDPVGGAKTGSAWPALAVRYHDLTGRRLVLVPAARSASAQHVSATEGGGNWDETGQLYGAATQALRSALDRLTAEGQTPVFRGVIWDQGGRDAQAIDAGKTTKEQYRSALTAMIGRFRADFGASTPFWIIRLGTDSGSDSRGWREVREAQEEVAASLPNTHIAYRETVGFYPTFHRDRFHYNQEGLNRIGAGAAHYIAQELD